MRSWLCACACACASACGGRTPAPAPTTPPIHDTVTHPAVEPPPPDDTRTDDAGLAARYHRIEAAMPPQCQAYAMLALEVLACPRFPEASRGSMRASFDRTLVGWTDWAHTEDDDRRTKADWMNDQCSKDAGYLSETRTVTGC